MRILEDNEEGVVLVYPEFSGNQLYQSLGNLQVDGRIGVVVPDFETGNVLFVTGRAEVLVDTGITNGGDIVAAVALGASAALVGRAYLYGLMAGGRAGVAKVAEILRADVVRTLQLLGVTSVDELGPQHVRLR